jgi:uridine phosphorylase
LNNPNVKEADADVLYHFALNTESHNFKDMFGDVKVR